VTVDVTTRRAESPAVSESKSDQVCHITITSVLEVDGTGKSRFEEAVQPTLLGRLFACPFAVRARSGRYYLIKLRKYRRVKADGHDAAFYLSRFPPVKRGLRTFWLSAPAVLNNKIPYRYPELDFPAEHKGA